MSSEGAKENQQPELTAKPVPSILGLLAAHFGPASASVLFLYLVLKVLVVAHFNTSTALGLVAEGGTTALLVGTMTSALGVLVTLANGAVAIAYVDRRPTLEEPHAKRQTLLYVLLFLLAVNLFISPAVLALAIVGLNILVLIPRTLKPKKELSSADRWLFLFVVTMMPILVALVMLGHDPWWPTERIRDQQGKGVTGYVVKSTPESTVVLVDKTRQLVRIEGKVTRTYCDSVEPVLTVGRLSEPLAALFWETPKYPRCKTLP